MILRGLLLVIIGFYLSSPLMAKDEADSNPWMEAVHARVQSVFKDHENQRITSELIAHVHSANPNRIDEFEFFKRESNYGSSAQLDGLLKTFSEREVQKIDLLSSWKGGIKFDFDFGGATDDKKIVTSPKIARYGLKVKSIEPSEDIRLFAANNVNDFEYAIQAPKADVEWEIVRVDQLDSSARPYQFQRHDYNDGSSNYLDQFTSTRFKGNISPDPKTDFVKLKGLPPQVISINQDKGFYSLLINTNSQFAPESYSHVLNMNFDSLLIRNERDKDFESTKYTLGHHNKKLSLASTVNFLPIEKRYQTEFKLLVANTNFEFITNLGENLEKAFDATGNTFELKASRSF